MGSEQRQRQCVIKVRVTDAEKQAIEQRAAAVGLSQSGYLRRLGLNAPVHNRVDQRAIRDLAGVAGDLARLGGLLKVWLSNDERFQAGWPTVVDVQALYGELRTHSQRLKDHVQALRR